MIHLRRIALTVALVAPAQAGAETTAQAILTYASCIGASDGYHVATEPYTTDTLLSDIHRADIASLHAALTQTQRTEFEQRRAEAEAAWWARMQVLETQPLDSPLWEQEATFSWQCGQQRQALVGAGVLD